MCKPSRKKSANAAADSDWKISAISKKYPSYRNQALVSVYSWLKHKQQDDEAEGLWRIYDTLYDFSDFVDRHPGGSFWLRETKGTDITESFESHHISTMPEKMLAKYKVRQAAQPRNYKFTMHENGFYKTLQRRVRAKLNRLDYTPSKRSDLMHLGLLLATFVFVAISAVSNMLLFEFLAALSLCWLSIAAHNYFHQRDNWRMYTFNLTLMSFYDWRISHALSHHVYTNSLHDLEMSMFEPFLCWVPSLRYAPKWQRLISVMVQPVIYAVIFPIQMLSKIIHSVSIENIFQWHDLIGFTIPLFMLLLSSQSFVSVILQWGLIIAMSSFLFGLIGLNASHHDPKIYHDGDKLRETFDWGIFQMDTIIDRGDIQGSEFLVLTHFGEHSLHHLFPTLDHSILPQLYPEFRQTLKEFQVDIRLCTHLDHIIGQNQQLLRTTPNPWPPGHAKNAHKA